MHIHYFYKSKIKLLLHYTTNNKSFCRSKTFKLSYHFYKLNVYLFEKKNISYLFSYHNVK